ncbi:SDR family NAD(P)-dependent oxidoreductase [Agrobacterium sp. ICMP 6402]|uniref:SDR family NAD(P)-dependent oxidoreductase n=1 Tax=Agrobacterium sp. ICMP 6402 TaxID=2292443 RepID=UPI001295D7DB|nr:SDR family NAD(P)-dependent oxidoreductase [Agrobacterium sp. ICMP 6402]MQB12444.1 SDR family NAD(P)-dependent oxidoreductase [Agrobacterium sp. ICMP 6402]
MDIQFVGQRVLVTGAARGIGRAICEAFAADGAAVLATDVNLAELEPLKQSTIAKRGGSISIAALDVTDEAGIARLVEEESDGFDIFVHVAGGVLGQTRKPVETVPAADWDSIYNVNVRGAFLIARAVVPAMKARGAGKMVFISSGAGLGVSLTGIQAYASAKAALISLARQLAHELGPFGINVNAVAPGFLRTSPDYERQWASYGDEGQEAMLAQIPLRRIGLPDDISNAVLFLASPFASWITGQTLSVSGGPVS